MQTKDLPILLLTGYLGSGKTTLVNHILNNKAGIRFAVIVNDIGEVNIDASLIQRGGVVKQDDSSLVALENGCICCTLQTDLIEQVLGLVRSDRFDYIVIEASGVCDPSPIVQTLLSVPRLAAGSSRPALCHVDNVVTVVDALRMSDEFNCGERLQGQVGEEDIENLLIQQIEFCSMILLNKVSEVSSEQLDRIQRIIRSLQPEAPVIPCDFADVDLGQLIGTRCFNFRRVAASAGWVHELEKPVEEQHEHHCHQEEEHDSHDRHHEHGHDHHDDHHDDHHHHDHDHDHDHGDSCGIAGHGAHCHCHHHHHEGGETAEYGISSFVYYRRAPFDMNRFDYFVVQNWPAGIIRAKGICYFSDRQDMSYLFEQAGRQKQLSEAGMWYATLEPEKIQEMLDQDPGFRHDWDPKYGDRMQKIVFIGQHLDRESIERQLDKCLVEEA